MKKTIITNDQNRKNDVINLIELNGSVKECRDRLLNKYNFDYDGEKIVLKIINIKNVMEKYICGCLSKDDIEIWADAVEMRDDIEYDEADMEEIIEVLFLISNPVINGENTKKKILEMLAQM